MSSGLLIPPALGGWTRSQLIELADRRTERRGSKTLDLDSEFLMALQHFLMETRWSWRRKTSVFNLQTGVWQYDLTAMLPTPSPNAYTSQPTWQLASAQRAGGFDYLMFPPGTVLPVLTPGQTVYLLSESNFSFNGPVVITQPGTNNLLTNPGFESGMSGWSADGISIVTAPVHGGTQALSISGAQQKTVGQPTFTLTAGVAVTVTAWIYLAAYAGASPVDVTVATYDALGNAVAVYPASANTATIGSWQSVTVTFTPTSSEVFGGVYCQINSQFSSTAQGQVTAYFDDISVVQGAGPNLVVNGNFEAGIAGWTPSDYSIVTAPVHGGTSALQISTTEAGVGAANATTITLIPGVPVSMSAWVYIVQSSGSEAVAISIEALSALGGHVSWHSAAADMGKIGVWQQVQLTFTPTTSEVTGRFECAAGTGTGQVTAIFDDVDVRMAVVGTQDGYDTTFSGTANDVMGLQPFSYLKPPNARDLQQFCKHGVKFFPNYGNPTQWAEITPLFERELQDSAIYSNRFFPLPGKPSQYFLMPGAFLVLCVTPPPDQDYPIMIDYWSVPNVPADSVDESIPLVPAFLHHVLLKRLEAQIFRYTLGEGAAKYQAAMAEYNMLVSRYQGMDGMVPGEQIDYSDDDDYESRFANSQNAVQSTV